MNGWSKRRHSLLFMNSLPQMEEMRPEQNQNQATVNVISLSLFPLPFLHGLSPAYMDKECCFIKGTVYSTKDHGVLKVTIICMYN